MDDIRSWWEVPSIAHFCSLFRAAFDLTDFDIEDLEDALLESQKETGSDFIQDLVCRLLNGCYGRKDISAINWDLYVRDIIKYKWEIIDHPIRQKEDFHQLTLREKVEVIHAICEFRLDAEDVFELIKGFEGDNMRVEPLGRDREGALYWYFYGSRLYKEDPEPKKEVTKEEKRAREKVRKKQLKRQQLEEKRQRKLDKVKVKAKQRQEKKKCSPVSREEPADDVRRSGRLRTKQELRKQEDSEADESSSSSEEEESSEDTADEPFREKSPPKLSEEDKKRPFVCQMADCSKRYTDGSSCRKHMRLVHPKEYARRCSRGGISWQTVKDTEPVQEKPNANCSSKKKTPAKGGKTPNKQSKTASTSKQKTKSAKKATPNHADTSSSRRSSRLRQKVEIEESDKSDNDDDEGFEDKESSDSDTDDNRSVMSEMSRKSTISDTSRRSSRGMTTPVKRIKPLKKPPSARKGSMETDSLDCKKAMANDSDSSDSVADTECVLCGREDGDDCMLLCDECDGGYHTYCLTPPLAAIPRGNWSCLQCVSESEKKFEKKTEPKARSTIKTEQPAQMECDIEEKTDNSEPDPEIEQVVMPDKDKTLEQNGASLTSEQTSTKTVTDDTDMLVDKEDSVKEDSKDICDSKSENDKPRCENDIKSENETECDTKIDAGSTSDAKVEQSENGDALNMETDKALCEVEPDKQKSCDKEMTPGLRDEESETKTDDKEPEVCGPTVEDSSTSVTAGHAPSTHHDAPSSNRASSFADAFLMFTQPSGEPPADDKPNTVDTNLEHENEPKTSKNEAETSKNEPNASENEPETSKNGPETSKNGPATSKNQPETSNNDSDTPPEPETDKNDSIPELEKTKPDKPKAPPRPPQPLPSSTRWHVVCSTLDDWENLMEWFQESPVKCERTLSSLIREDFLPILPEIIDSREKEQRRRQREQEMRKSTRITYRMQEKMDQEKILAEAQAEEDKARLACEDERRQQEEQERVAEENRLREERARAREERAKRMSMREERARLMAEGKEIPPELIYTGLPAQRYKDDGDSDENKSDMLNAESFEALLKVVHAIQNHRESWPFLDPVNEDEAPGYHDVIKRPMDLSKIEKKIQLKEYRTQHHFLADFRLMFKNCSRFNGPDSEFTACSRSLEKSLKNLVKKHLQDVSTDVYAQDGDFVMSVPKGKLGEKRFRPKRAASSRALQTVHRAFESSEEEDDDDLEPLVIRKSSDTPKSRNSTSLLLQEMIELKRAREKIATGMTDDKIIIRGRPPPTQQSLAPGLMVIPKGESPTSGVLGNSTTREIKWNIQRQQKLTNVDNAKSRIQQARQQKPGSICLKPGAGGEIVPATRGGSTSRVIKIMAASGGSNETTNQAVRNAAENVKVSADGFLMINGKNSGIKVTPNTKIVIQPPGATPPSLAVGTSGEGKDEGLLVKKIPTPAGMQPLTLSTPPPTTSTVVSVASNVPTSSYVTKIPPAISDVRPHRIPIPSILNMRPPAPVNTNASPRTPAIVNVNGSPSQPIRHSAPSGQIPVSKPGANANIPSQSKPLSDLEAKKKTFDIAQRLLTLNMKRKLAGGNGPLSPHKMMKIDAENLIRTTESVYTPTNIDNDIKAVSSNVVKAVNIAGDILDSYYAALSGQPKQPIQTTKSSVIISSVKDVPMSHSGPAPTTLTSPSLLSGGSVIRAPITMVDSHAVIHTPVTTVSFSNGIISNVPSSMQYISSTVPSQTGIPNANIRVNVHRNVNTSSTMNPLSVQPIQSNTASSHAVVQRLSTIPRVNPSQVLSLPNQAVNVTQNPTRKNSTDLSEPLSPIEALYMGQKTYHATNTNPPQNTAASFPVSSPNTLMTKGNRPALFDIFEPEKKQSLMGLCEDDFGFANLERSPPRMMSLARQLEAKSTITQGSPVRAASVLQALKSKLTPATTVGMSRVTINTQDQYLSNPQSTNFCPTSLPSQRDVYKVPVPHSQVTRQIPAVNSTIHLLGAVNTQMDSTGRYQLHSQSGNTMHVINPVLQNKANPALSQMVGSAVTVSVQNQPAYNGPSVLVSPLSPAQQNINTNMMLTDHSTADRIQMESLTPNVSVLHNSLPNTDTLQSPNILQTQYFDVSMNKVNHPYYNQTSFSQLGNSALEANQTATMTSTFHPSDINSQYMSPVKRQPEIVDNKSCGLQNNTSEYTARTIAQDYTQMASPQYTPTQMASPQYTPTQMASPQYTPISPQHYTPMTPQTVQMSTSLSEISPTMQINRVPGHGTSQIQGHGTSQIQGQGTSRIESMLATPVEQDGQRAEVEPMMSGINSW